MPGSESAFPTICLPAASHFLLITLSNCGAKDLLCKTVLGRGCVGEAQYNLLYKVHLQPALFFLKLS